MTDNFEKDIDVPSKPHACDLCGAYYCNGDDCRLYQAYISKEQECGELKKINKANAKTYEKQWYELEKHKQTITEIKDCFEYYEKEQDYLSFVSELNKTLRKVSEVLDE